MMQSARLPALIASLAVALVAAALPQSGAADESRTLKLDLRGVFSWDDDGLRSRGLVFNPELEYEKPAFAGT